MAKPRSYSFYLRAVIGLLMISMTVYRLVSVQLREFTTEITPNSNTALIKIDRNFLLECRVPPQGPLSGYAKAGPVATVSPGFFVYLKAFCVDGVLNLTEVIKWNEWFIITAAISIALLTRVVVPEWLLALGVGVMLLSRGSLLHGISRIHQDAPLNLFFSMWMLTSTVFLSTGATAPLVLSSVMMILLSALDRSFAGIALALPITAFATLLFTRSKGKKLVENGDLTQGRILAPLDFRDWLRPRRHSGQVLLASLVAGFISILLLKFQPAALRYLVNEPAAGAGALDPRAPIGSVAELRHFGVWARTWLSLQSESLDLHSASSLILILVTATMGYGKRFGTLTIAARTFVIALIIITTGAAYTDYMDAHVFVAAGLLKNSGEFIHSMYARRVAYWADTILVGLGAAACYQLLSHPGMYRFISGRIPFTAAKPPRTGPGSKQNEKPQ